MMVKSSLAVRAAVAVCVLGLVLGCEAQVNEEGLGFPDPSEDVIQGPAEDVGVVGEEVVELIPEDLSPGATEVKCDDETACKEIADLLPLCQEVACASELGVCVIGLSPAGTECAMDDACSLGGECAEGVCTSIGARDCSDDNACTVDTCDPLTGCLQEPMEGSEPCEDGLVCTVGDACDAGVCVAGTEAMACDDENPCTEDGCDEEAGGCVNTPVDGECDDGDACTDGDLCADGGCFGGEPLNCDDENPCTNETCSPDAGCEYSNVLNGAGCDNGDPCGAVQECQSGECVAIVETDCDDDNPCTVDGCEPGEGCYHLNSADGKPCEDGNACTDADSCQAGVCAGGDAISCDDGEFCNGVETCEADTGCTSGSAPDLDDGNDCTLDACDEDADEVTHTPDDSLCDDGEFCNGAEFCNAITGCKSGQPPTVDDFIPCTTDACDEEADEVTHTPDHDTCDNGTFCDGVEQCVVGEGCKTGTPPDVDDGIDCTLDLCDFDTDAPQHLAQNSQCDNGEFCDGAEVCNVDTGCEAGSAVDVDDGVSCTTDTCDEDLNQVVNTPDHTLCDNGLFCDGVEVCDATDGCQDGPDVDVADGITCTSDSCNEDTDTVEHTPNDILCTDNDFCNGDEVCNPAVGCEDGAPPTCDDDDECTVDSCAAGECANVEIDGCNCTPDCTAKECGGDGCGGSCGSCPGVAPVCNADQKCEAACNPACDGKECGDDGCGGTCGTCPGVAPVCNADQQCEAECFADCAGKECGDDGCGGVCGSCPGVAPICNADQKCEAECVKNCAGKQCGPDGCGGSCGGCAPGATCSDAGSCEMGCVADCNGKECGGDGCGGVCGSCPGVAPICNADQKCEAECTPTCLPSQECGGDGCGGLCGECSVADAESCQYGLAGIATAGTCVFDCFLAGEGSCDDEDSCTVDHCEIDPLTEISTCHYESLDGCQGCEVDEQCINADKCSVGTCEGGSCTYAPKVCDNAGECEVALCDANTGGCVVAPQLCDDEDPCTDDYCDIDTGDCKAEAIVCDSAAPCLTSKCEDGECVDGAPVMDWSPCDDGNACT
ncbi:MAG: hypothetical protein VX938_03500, partial [Myxococcota bacterium]|nr:hypothetical protein [Myxococcota bacterium]